MAKRVFDDTTITKIADPLRTLSGTTSKMTPVEMAAAGTDAAAEMQAQAALIAQIKDGLQGKEIGGGVGMQDTQVVGLVRNGSGYIDLDLDAANNNLKIEIQFRLNSLPAGYWYLIRAYENENSNTTRILFAGQKTVYCNLNSKASGGTLSYSFSFVAGEVYTAVLQPETKKTFSFNINGTKKMTQTRSDGATLVGKSVLLFHTSADNLSITAYNVKVYDNGELVRDCVPDIKSGEAGLRDKVTGRFFGNVGDGSFEAEMLWKSPQ